MRFYKDYLFQLRKHEPSVKVIYMTKQWSGTQASNLPLCQLRNANQYTNKTPSVYSIAMDSGQLIKKRKYSL